MAKDRRPPRPVRAILLECAAMIDPGPCHYPLGRGATERPVARLGGRRDGRLMKAARAVWILANGDPGEAWVLHTCGQGMQGCLRLAHLYLGDHAQNMADMVADGHATTGERQHMTKLSDQDVRDIRAAYAAGGVSQRSLGESYGLPQSCVSEIVHRKTWKHVD